MVIDTLKSEKFTLNDTGWINEIKHIPSPNCSPRPEDSNIELIVIHNISLPPEQFGGSWIAALFTNQLDPNAHPYFAEIHQLKVSAHVLIRRDGEIIQFVPFSLQAWHAGVSYYQGRTACNQFSVGIELEGADTLPFETVQYDQLIRLLKCLRQHYPRIAQTAIVGHSDIAPGRKTDPGPFFDWDRIWVLLD